MQLEFFRLVLLRCSGGELLRARLFVVKPYSLSTRVCPVLISEIFEPRTRSVGTCLAVIGGTVLAVTAGFGPYAQQLGRSNCLCAFATMGAFSLFQLYVDLPETTDRLLDQCWGDVDDETQRSKLKKTGVLIVYVYVACSMLFRPASAVCLLASDVAGGVELVKSDSLIHLRGPHATGGWVCESGTIHTCTCLTEH